MKARTYLKTKTKQVALTSIERGTQSFPLASYFLLCDLPLLLFVYFQVNNGVLYFLDYYVEDIYIMVLSVLVSMHCSDFVFTAYHVVTV